MYLKNVLNTMYIDYSWMLIQRVLRYKFKCQKSSWPSNFGSILIFTSDVIIIPSEFDSSKVVNTFLNYLIRKIKVKVFTTHGRKKLSKYYNFQQIF